MQLRARRTLIKIETDAGVSGYGECHGGGLLARKVIAGLSMGLEVAVNSEK